MMIGKILRLKFDLELEEVKVVCSLWTCLICIRTISTYRVGTTEWKLCRKILKYQKDVN